MNRTLAARCAELSALAYAHPDSARQALGSANVRWLSDDGEPMVVTENGATIVAFRGTRAAGDVWSWADVREDLDCPPVPWPIGGLVHRGFATSVCEIKHELLPILRGPGPVYLTGHSLGAARAAIAASLGPTAAGVYLFGCPRPGNGAFWRTVLPPVFRFNHALDIVPRLPPPLDFRHGGQRWHVGRNGSLTRSPWRPWPDWCPVPLRQGVLDHRIGEYAAKLKGPQL